ncbi:hypothetical protein [Desulfitibacter alkalitolerans]|uniref:hypothetical protein n=1 Tax=Desulfitibacter alkalitolerans TaxID=264641 RepID=UPI00048842DE|nr:hypothetical protein [Desulfitibacter alkalitolerans]
MAKRLYFIDFKKCLNCSICLPRESCEYKCIVQEAVGDALFIDNSCRGCGKCLLLCSQNAIKHLEI